METAPKPDPAEEHVRIVSPVSGLSLFSRYLPPTQPAGGQDRVVVLYVHRGTFASTLPVAHRFDGRSRRDASWVSGFNVWGLDFHGFDRLSDPWPAMQRSTNGMAPLGRAADTSLQLECAAPPFRRMG